MAKKTASQKFKIEIDPTSNAPRRIHGLAEKPSSAAPRRIAEAFLKKVAGDLQIKADLSQLKFDQVRESLLGRHVLFQQQHAGRPITGAWVRVDIDPSGKVFQVQSDLIPEKVMGRAAVAAAAPPPAGAPPTAERAKELALAATDFPGVTSSEVVSVEEVMFPMAGQPVAAWKVMIVQQPRGEWKVYLDAVTGAVLEKINLLKEQDGRGRVFDPNPVVTLNDTTLEDNSTIPEAAYTEVTLRDLDASGHLDGPFVSTSPTANRVGRADGQFLFRRPDRAFKEVMVYFHIDRVQRYIQQLGFVNVLNRSIKVNVDGIPDDNSFYSPMSKSLTFGTGGVDDAEDADIILHEYGHAIQDDQVPSFGPSGEARAMGEGFGDYLAASFFAERKAERLRPCVGTWDAVAYSGDEPPSLRRLDSTKKYPRDLVGEEHADGEIWSACLWQLRAAVGAPVADRLVLAHHFLLSPRASFEDAAKALLTADEQLNQGRNAEAIRKVFVQRGILPNTERNNKRAGVRFREIHEHRAGIKPARAAARHRGGKAMRKPARKPR